MENSVKQRLKEVLKWKEETVNSISKKLKIIQVTLNNQINGNTEVSLSTIIALIDLYKDINAEWLLTGSGTMIKSNNQVSEHNSGVGIIGNNVNGGGINDNQIILEMLELLKKKDEQIDNLLKIKQINN